MRAREVRCRLGFFIAMNGFANTVQVEHLKASDKEHLIVAVGPQDLARLVMPGDRGAVLKELHDRARLVATNGNGH